VAKNDTPFVLLVIGVPTLVVVILIQKIIPDEFDILLTWGWVAFMLWLWFEAMSF
jgi:hypothetical protein